MSPKAKPDAVTEDEGDDDAPSPMTRLLSVTPGRFTPTPELAAVVGPAPLTRIEVVKRLWEYIKTHALQDPKNPRMIRADAALRPVFGADSVSMFEMTQKVNKHLKN